MSYFRSLFEIDRTKIDIAKGIRQGLLMLISLLVFYALGDLRTGLLVSMGTLSHIYVFGGTLNSKIRTILIVTVNLAVAMTLGSLTGHNHLLFAFFLLVYTVVPYYICNVLELKGPSSTFFLVAYGLASIMPFQPEIAFIRGGYVLVGGVLSLLIVCLEALLTDRSPDKQVVKNDFNMLIELLDVFENQQQFDAENKEAIAILTKGSGLLHSAKPVFKRTDIAYERSLLIHHLAQGIYAEILELNTRGNKMMPVEIKEMIAHIRLLIEGEYPERWHQKVDVDEQYHQLLDYIFEVEEILYAPAAQVNHKLKTRKPHYMKRIINNLNPQSMVFMMTLKYALIMIIVVFIAILFHIERPYWVALSAHTVLLGNTTINSIQRAVARVIGTTGGMLLILLLIAYHPSFLLILILIAVTCAITEMVVVANYSVAMIFITMQVLLMSGIAAGHLSPSFAYLRIIDVIIGVSLTTIGVFIFSRVKAQERLPEMIAAAVRIEAQLFHHFFSPHHYTNSVDKLILEMNLAILNAKWTYQNAAGELQADQKLLSHYYPALFQLEQLSYMLTRLSEKQNEKISRENIGLYLTAFEEIAAYFETKQGGSTILLPEIENHYRLKTAIHNLQSIRL